MQNGFIFELINKTIESLNYLNVVNLFKLIAIKLSKSKISKKELISNINISIDIFITLKWILMLFLWLNNINSPFWTLLVFYLLWSNLHTYFYHHLWKKEKNSGEEKMRRRFVNLILAIFYSNISFAYLYSKVFEDNFIWNLETTNKNFQSLIYSFSQSFFVGSNIISTKNLLGELLVSTQLLISFIFIIVILATSIPSQTEKEI